MHLDYVEEDFTIHTIIFTTLHGYRCCTEPPTWKGGLREALPVDVATGSSRTQGYILFIPFLPVTCVFIICKRYIYSIVNCSWLMYTSECLVFIVMAIIVSSLRHSWMTTCLRYICRPAPFLFPLLNSKYICSLCNSVWFLFHI